MCKRTENPNLLGEHYISPGVPTNVEPSDEPASCTGCFKVLWWCSHFPHASLFDAQHVVAKQPLCFRHPHLLKTLLSEIVMTQRGLWQSQLYAYTCVGHVRVWGCFFPVHAYLKCLPFTVIQLSSGTCRVQWRPLNTHRHTCGDKSWQIKTPHSFKSCEKPVYWWSGLKTTGGCTEGVEREKREVIGEGSWGAEAIRGTQAAGACFIISHCNGSRWDNWPPKLNAQHAFLMSPHCCTFNIEARYRRW